MHTAQTRQAGDVRLPVGGDALGEVARDTGWLCSDHALALADNNSIEVMRIVFSHRSFARAANGEPLTRSSPASNNDTTTLSLGIIPLQLLFSSVIFHTFCRYPALSKRLGPARWVVLCLNTGD
jgi:hypothetical protein